MRLALICCDSHSISLSLSIVCLDFSLLYRSGVRDLNSHTACEASSAPAVFLRKLDFFPILTAVSSFSLLRLDEQGKNDQITKYINSIRARIKCLIAIEDASTGEFETVKLGGLREESGDELKHRSTSEIGTHLFFFAHHRSCCVVHRAD